MTISSSTATVAAGETRAALGRHLQSFAKESRHNRQIRTSMAPARCTNRDAAQSQSNGFIPARARVVARFSRRDRRHQFGHGHGARPRSVVGLILISGLTTEGALRVALTWR